jgi:O-antigen ligase
MLTPTSTRPDPALDNPARTLFLATVALVGWGALAFGSPYAWAYVPLAVGCAALGLTVFWRARHVSVPKIGDGPVLAALAVFAACAALQLVPLPPEVRESLSPASTALLQAIDLPFAVATLAPGGPPAPWHPLTVSSTATLKSLALLGAFGVLLAGLTSFFSRESLEPLAPPLLGFGLLLAFVGILQKAMLGDHAWGGMRIYGFWEPQYKLSTPFGPFVNKNHFAGWMLMAIPLGLGYFLGLAEVGMRDVRRDWRHRLLWLSSHHGGHLQLVFFATMIMIASLLMTASRSGIGCFVVAMAIAAIFAVRHQRGWKGRVVIAAALVVLAAVPLAWSRVDVVSRLATVSPNDSSIGLRRAVWHDAIAMIRDFPLTGTGLNTFGIATAKYQTALTDMRFREAHNDYLQLAAEGGLLLGVPALAVILLFARAVWIRFRQSADDRLSYWLRFGATTGLVAIALQAAVEFSLQMPGNAVMFVVLCAAALHRAPYVKMPRRAPRVA